MWLAKINFGLYQSHKNHSPSLSKINPGASCFIGWFFLFYTIIYSILDKTTSIPETAFLHNNMASPIGFLASLEELEYVETWISIGYDEEVERSKSP